MGVTSRNRNVGRNLARDLLLRCAWRLLSGSGTKAPPYDPWHVAELKGVPVRERSDIAGIDGYIDTEGDVRIIVLNSQASYARRRFTLAHELGHLVLMEMCDEIPLRLRRYQGGTPRPGSRPDPVEERLCNEFAAELLMPRCDIREFWRDRIATPESLMECARTFDVSLLAACTRAVEHVAAMHISFWDTCPWFLERWARGIPITRRLSREINAAIAALTSNVSLRGHRFLEQTVQNDQLVLRARDCARESVLVVLTSKDSDRVKRCLANVAIPVLAPVQASQLTLPLDRHRADVM